MEHDSNHYCYECRVITVLHAIQMLVAALGNVIPMTIETDFAKYFLELAKTLLAQSYFSLWMAKHTEEFDDLL